MTNELSRVSSNNVAIGTIVGGFAEVKQRRVLERKRPPILVCTPGRLWELVSFPDAAYSFVATQLLVCSW